MTLAHARPEQGAQMKKIEIPLFFRLPPTEYPRRLVAPIMGLDGLIFLIGLAVLVSPFLMGYFPDAYPTSVPGSQETTIHAALGAGIATLAVFRATLAYGSAWVELLNFVLGLITLSMPRIMSMQWNDGYSRGHLLAGGAIMALSMVSGLITIVAMRKMKLPSAGADVATSIDEGR
jgi:hypothetical protein